jgi:hypothetical protein
MNVIVPLWSVPRSISTAFERMMMVRGDFTVFHEPFAYYFYLEAHGADAVGLNADPTKPKDFDGTLEMIKHAAQDRPVFFKDMSYYVISHADEAFVAQFVNTFIIRDPALTLVSYYKLDPNFTMKEAGFEDQFKLFELVKKVTGQVPAVVDADDVIASPHTVVEQYCKIAGIEFRPESLTWRSEVPEQWQDMEYWHQEAAKSTGFIKDAETFDITVNDVPRLKEMYEVSMPYYEAMYDARIRP